MMIPGYSYVLSVGFTLSNADELWIPWVKGTITSFRDC